MLMGGVRQQRTRLHAWRRGESFAQVGLPSSLGALIFHGMGLWSEEIKRRLGYKSGRRPARRGVPLPDEALSGWCRDASQTLGLGRLAGRVAVVWNGRLQTTAGRAWWPDGVIELNPKLREFGDEELWRTVRHELAHLVAYERAGRRKISAHGAEWRMACRELGIPGESVKHVLPLGGRRVARRFSYSCAHCATRIERVRRIRGSAACYECCRRYAGGGFDERFLLVERKLQCGA